MNGLPRTGSGSGSGRLGERRKEWRNGRKRGVGGGESNASCLSSGLGDGGNQANVCHAFGDFNANILKQVVLNDAAEKGIVSLDWVWRQGEKSGVSGVAGLELGFVGVIEGDGFVNERGGRG